MINLSGLLAGVAAQETALEQKVKGAEGKELSQTELLKLQHEVGVFQQIAGMASSIVSDVKQTAQGIIQKI